MFKNQIPLLLASVFSANIALAEEPNVDAFDIEEAYMDATRVSYQTNADTSLRVTFIYNDQANVTNTIRCDDPELDRLERHYTSSALNAALLKDTSLMAALGQVQDAFAVCEQ